MDHSTDHQAKIIHLSHHKILDQVTEAAITQATMTATTDRTTAETTTETEITNNNKDTNREIRTTQTGMTITKIENRFDNRRRPNKYQHHRNQHKPKSSSNSQTKTLWK